ncbi:MAG: glycoside hydrolase family 10 protein, partial [Eubacteriales bacterium]
MDKNGTQVKKHAERQRHILIAVFILIFAILTAACVFLMMHTPKGMGPQALSPMTEDRENTRTSAMFDPNREVRGIWIPSVLNLTFPSEAGLSAEAMRAELDAIVETARDADLNTICFQVRPSADALYESDLFPTSVYLSGEQGQPADSHFDPLAYLCEIAAGEDETDAIAVYAWINPLRVTCSGQDIHTLSGDNPAVLHPEWTFMYQNACYFNAGIPEVRTLIADGVKEICEKYPVAGIIFDDYFYPYPAYGNDGTLLQPDDAETYLTYGSGYDTIADFRRGSVNEMVRLCYDSVKSVSEYIRFGVAPFGIWQNDNGSNGGSDTGGMEAYSAIYCDALAWMQGGYVDFIAPQIYWQFSTSVARYDTLVRWWNAQCDAYGIPMWVSHAIYQYETWNNPGEMRNQITFARAEAAYRGSLFYGYPQLEDNTFGVTEELRGVFSEDILYYEKETVYRENIETENPIHINVPANNSRYDEEGTYILGQSDPAAPLYCDGEPVSRTRSGYFALYKLLKQGENTFVFTQNGVEYRHTVWKRQYAPVTQTSDETDETDENDTAAETETGTPSSDTVPFIPLTVSVVSPTTLTAVCWEEGIAVSVRANADASVTAVLGSAEEAGLEPTVLKQGEVSADGSALYTAVIPLPQTDAGAYIDCGSLLITAEKEGYDETTAVSGAHIYSLGAGAVIPVTVTEDGTYLKTAPDSWYYDDYIPASSGMTAAAYEIRDGYARISLAGNTAYLDALGIRVSDTVPSGMAQFGRPEIRVTEKETVLCIPATESVPVNCVKNGTVFSVILYRGEHTADTEGTLDENPLLSDYSVNSGGEEENAYV